eukprot:COSAG01_NODE_5582_length_4168_cov_2.695257_5_plen_64_part_00
MSHLFLTRNIEGGNARTGTITIGGLGQQQAAAVMQVALDVQGGPPIPNGGEPAVSILESVYID